MRPQPSCVSETRSSMGVIETQPLGETPLVAREKLSDTSRQSRHLLDRLLLDPASTETAHAY